ncbi:T9SS type A sorting domain-containing protein [bacterium]|nr:T9SS type A sorting domain-containing protein [bacterium]
MRIALSFVLALALTGAVSAQEVLYEEHFLDGGLALDWYSVWEGGENIVSSPDENAPDEDGWIGHLTNEGSGGGVGTTCFGPIDMEDYSYSAWVKTTVGTSSYNGVVARMDTTGGSLSYYSFRSDFDSDARLQLVKYPGESFGPTIISEWTGEDIPGGMPAEDSWHQFRIDVFGDQISLWYDDTEMTGSPFTVADDTYLAAGAPGVYIFNFMGTAATDVDGIMVTDGEVSSVGDNPLITIPSSAQIVSTYPNPFNPETTISFEVNGAKTSLAVFDVLGRQVATLVDGSFLTGMNKASWNATSQPAGTYFVVLKTDAAQDVRKVMLVK